MRPSLEMCECATTVVEEPAPSSHERFNPRRSNELVFIETLTATSPHNVALNGGPAVAISFGAVNTFLASGTNPAGAPNVASTWVIVNARQHGGHGNGHGWRRAALMTRPVRLQPSFPQRDLFPVAAKAAAPQ